MFPETPQSAQPGTILSAQNFLLIPQTDLLTSIEAASGLCSDPITSSLEKRDGLFWSQGKIFVPLETRPLVLRTFHDLKLAGHFGVRKSTELVSRSFWWPGWMQDCKTYVASCTQCQRNKGPNTKSWGLLKPLPIPECPWADMSMDFIVDLPPPGGFTTILVIIDRLSKMAHFLPMIGTPSAANTAKIFFKEITRLHGVLKSITSDRGVQFTSKFWRELCKSLEVKTCLPSAYHPQSNGQTERTNQTLEQYLCCFCSASQDDWPSLLPYAEFTSPIIIQCIPLLIRSFHPSFLPENIPESSVPAVQDRVASVQVNFQRLWGMMQDAQESYKKLYDRGRKENPAFKVGEEVWLSATNLRLPIPSRKLGPRFIGPFKIKRAINPVAFELVLPASYRIHPVFHSSLLKPITPSFFPGRDEPPPPPVKVDGENEYEVESIMGCRKRGRQLQYLVKWKGYPPEDNSWEPSRNLHAPRLIRAFHQEHPELMASLSVRSSPLRGGHCQGNSPPSVTNLRPACVRGRTTLRLMHVRSGTSLRRACDGAPMGLQAGLFKQAQ